MDKRSVVLVCLSSALAAFALVAPRAGQAATVKRMHGSMCHINTGKDSEVRLNGGGAYDGVFGTWFQVRTPVNFASVFCSLSEDPDLIRTSITGVSVFGHLGDQPGVPDSAYAKACRSNSTADSGTCGNAHTITTPGEYVLSPEVATAWNTTQGFAYVFVGLTGYDDTVRGYSLQN